METESQNLLASIFFALPFALGAVVFFKLGMKHSQDFFYMDYRGKPKEKFKSSFLSNFYMALGIACLTSSFFSFIEKKFNWEMVPSSLLIGAIIFPIGFFGSYWQSFMANTLWGGFIPIVRKQYGYPQSEPSSQHAIDPSKLKIPRKMVIKTFVVALVITIGLNLLFYDVGWNGSVLSGVIFKLLMSGLLIIGLMITIISPYLSKRIQKLRDGEPLDDDS